MMQAVANTISATEENTRATMWTSLKQATPLVSHISPDRHTNTLAREAVRGMNSTPVEADTAMRRAWRRASWARVGGGGRVE
jgi:hypothetical protein